MQKIVIAIFVSAVIFLIVGFGAGFFVGAWSTEFGREFLGGVAEAVVAIEQPADTDNPQRALQQRFLVKYPGNWWIDEEEEQFDPETYFTIYSPGHAYVEFDISHYEVDSEEQLRDYVEHYRGSFSFESERKFDRWGDYSGKGMHLIGSLLGDEYQVRIFCYSSESISFTVTESINSEFAMHTDPGFEMIEATFELFESPEQYIE